jgi:hypothetical protein
VINLKGENLIDGNQAKTTGFASYPNPDGTKTPSAADNKFDVNLYEKGKGKSVELDYMSGRNYSSLANELGDIKYYMENVKDQTSLNFWKETSTSGTPGYQNPQGAGQKSSNYEKERVKDFKNYTPKTGEKKDNVKQVIKKE